MQFVPWYWPGGDAVTVSPEDLGYPCDSQDLSGGAFRLFSRDKPKFMELLTIPVHIKDMLVHIIEVLTVVTQQVLLTKEMMSL